MNSNRATIKINEQIARQGFCIDSKGDIHIDGDVIQTLTKEELIEDVKEYIKSKRFSEIKADNEFLTIKQTCRLLKVCPKTLKGYRDMGAIGFVKIPGSRRVLFTREQIELFIRKNSSNGTEG